MLIYAKKVYQVLSAFSYDFYTSWGCEPTKPKWLLGSLGNGHELEKDQGYKGEAKNFTNFDDMMQ